MWRVNENEKKKRVKTPLVLPKTKEKTEDY